MSRKEDGNDTKWAKVRTPLQYLALTHRQLLIFYGSVITAGSVTNRPFLVTIALVLAGVPQLAMLLLSVVDRKALKALGEEVTQQRELPQQGMHAALPDAIPPFSESLAGTDSGRISSNATGDETMTRETAGRGEILPFKS